MKSTRGMHGMRLNLRKYLLVLGLLVAVVISLVFSYLIWINPARSQANSSATSSTPNSALPDSIIKKVGDIYLPTNVVFNDDAKQYRLTSDTLDLTNYTKKQLVKWQYEDIKRLPTKSASTYQRYLHTKNALVLNYPVAVTARTVAETFNFKVSKYKSALISRIIIPLTKMDRIYLLDDKQEAVYMVGLKKATKQKLVALAKDKDNLRSEVTFEKIGDKYTLFYQDGIKVAQYSYLLNKETTGLFVNRLLGTNNTSAITAKEQDATTTYSDGAAMRLTIQKKTGSVTFNDYNSSNSRRNYSYENYLTAGLTNLNNIGVALDDVRYDCYDSKRHLLTYRNYINGYPVIAAESAGAYSILLTNSGKKRLDFSLYTLQIPVPSAGGAITLPNTRWVISQLLSRGYDQAKIGDIKVGYSWNQNQTSNQVVDLKPTYFVKYDNQWSDYQSLLNS